MKVDARAEGWARLQLAELPPRAFVALLRAFGHPEGVLAATPAQRRRHVPAAAAALLDAAPDDARLAATLAWLSAPAHDLVALDDPDYPQALLEIGDPPPVLYAQGRRDLLAMPAFAIVGSRNATPQGCEDAQAFAAALSAAGLTIVSGLALGIDAAAHRGGLRHAGKSIAVIGTGPDRIYPARNHELAHELAHEGLILSEFSPGTPPLKQNFPRRNRLVSGLARGVLVVEATLSSGSLITARLAGEQGREVFALPGSIHSPFSKGGHRLIRDGAKLVETAQDILDELGVLAVSPARPASKDERPHADADACAIFGALGHDPADVDTLVARTRLSAAVVVATLTALELEFEVAALAGGLWQRIGPGR
ncbi:MAG: DNA-processing protein DprA [Betaproteobacteria bacterium]